MSTTNRYDLFTYSDSDSDSDDHSSSDSGDGYHQKRLNSRIAKDSVTSKLHSTQKPIIPSISEPQWSTKSNEKTSSQTKPHNLPLSVNDIHSRQISTSSQNIDSEIDSYYDIRSEANGKGSIDELSQSLDMLALEISHRDDDENDGDQSANIIDDYSRDASSNGEENIKPKAIVDDWRIDDYSDFENEDSQLRINTDTDGLHISQEPSSSISAPTPTEGLHLGQHSRRVSQILESKAPLSTQVLVSGPNTEERPISWMPNDSDSDTDEEGEDFSRGWGAEPESSNHSHFEPNSKNPLTDTRSSEVDNSNDDERDWRSQLTETLDATINEPLGKARTVDVIPETPKDIPAPQIFESSPTSPIDRIDLPNWKATTTDYEEMNDNKSNDKIFVGNPNDIYNKNPLISPIQENNASCHSKKKDESYDGDLLTSWDTDSKTAKKQYESLKTPNVGSPITTPEKKQQNQLLKTPNVGSPTSTPEKNHLSDATSPNSWRISNSALESDNDWLKEAQKYIEIATNEPIIEGKETKLNDRSLTSSPISLSTDTKTKTKEPNAAVNAQDDEESDDQDTHNWRNESTEDDYENYYHPKPKKKSVTDAGSINTFLDDTETESDDDGGWKAYASDDDENDNVDHDDIDIDDDENEGDNESDSNSWDKDDDNYSFAPHDDVSIVKGGNSSTGSLSTGNFSAIHHEDDASSAIFNNSKDMRDQFVNSNRAFSINTATTTQNHDSQTSTVIGKDSPIDPLSQPQTISSSRYSSQPTGIITQPSQDSPDMYYKPRHLDSLPENDELNTSNMTDTTANDSSLMDTSAISNIPEPKARNMSQSSGVAEVINVKLDLSKMPAVDINKILSLPSSEKRIKKLRSAREELLHYDTNLAAFLKQAMRSHSSIADDIQLGPNASSAFRNAPTSSSGAHLTISSLTNNLTNNLPTPSFNRRPSTSTKKKSTKFGKILKNKLHF